MKHEINACLSHALTLANGNTLILVRQPEAFLNNQIITRSLEYFPENWRCSSCFYCVYSLRTVCSHPFSSGTDSTSDGIGIANTLEVPLHKDSKAMIGFAIGALVGFFLLASILIYFIRRWYLGKPLSPCCTRCRYTNESFEELQQSLDMDEDFV